MYETEITACIDRCLRTAAERTQQNSVWFGEYKARHNISSLRKLDREIFFRMYGKEPSEHEMQKVRFWRLSQHLPRNREECIRLGQALELSGDGMDHFFTEGLCSQRLSSVENREQMIEELFQQYLCRISYERLDRLNVKPGTQRRYLRHIFYADAMDCLDVDASMKAHCYREHLYSRNFAGEFRKYFEKDTIISRENILRLLILLLMPDVDSRILGEWLVRLGYAPLNQVRALNGYVDFAISYILGLAIDEPSEGAETDRERMKGILREYDHAVKMRIAKEEKSGNNAALQYLKNLRFMKFRSMDNESRES